MRSAEMRNAKMSNTAMYAVNNGLDRAKCWFRREAALYLLPFCAAVLLFASCGEHPIIPELIPEKIYWHVNFYANGGFGQPERQTILDGKKAAEPSREPPEVYREGFTLAGWFLENGVEWEFDSDVITCDTVLTAQWEKIPDTLYFDVYFFNEADEEIIRAAAEGTHVAELQPYAYDEDTGAFLGGDYTEKIGYTLAGWFPNGENEQWDFENDVVTAETYLYSRWLANSYTIIYDPNTRDIDGAPLKGTPSGVMPDGDNPEIRMYDDLKTLTPLEYSLQGYRFVGWNKWSNGNNTDGPDAGNYPDLSKENITAADEVVITLYAQWEINTYTVSFDIDEGVIPSADYDDQTIPFGERAVEPPRPIKPITSGGLYPDSAPDGWIFRGWYKNKSWIEKWDFESDIVSDRNITLYAYFTISDPIPPAELAIYGSNPIEQAMGYIAHDAYRPDQERYDYTLVLASNPPTGNYEITTGWDALRNHVEGVFLTIIGIRGAEEISAERAVVITNPGRALFNISDVATVMTLTLGQNITVRGTGGATAPVVNIGHGGALVMLEGSKITGNIVTAAAANAPAAAVHIAYDGNALTSWNQRPTFTMKGGEITGNSASGEYAGVRAAVIADGAGTILMEGGKISGNSGTQDVRLEGQGNYSALTMTGTAEIGSITMLIDAFWDEGWFDKETRSFNVSESYGPNDPRLMVNGGTISTSNSPIDYYPANRADFNLAGGSGGQMEGTFQFSPISIDRGWEGAINELNLALQWYDYHNRDTVWWPTLGATNYCCEAVDIGNNGGTYYEHFYEVVMPTVFDPREQDWSFLTYLFEGKKVIKSAPNYAVVPNDVNAQRVGLGNFVCEWEYHPYASGPNANDIQLNIIKRPMSNTHEIEYRKLWDLGTLIETK